MKLRLTLLGAAVVGAVVASAACQTYDFEPVEPLAISQTTERVVRVSRGLKPNMMLVVDQSFSMHNPILASDSRCPADCGAGGTCPQNCPTRIGDLRSAMSDFLSQYGTSTRLGLAVFPMQDPSPERNPCLPGEIQIDISSSKDVEEELRAHAQTIIQRIQQIQPTSGTPTALTLQAFASHPALNALEDGREDFILFLTDGLPNCNPELAASTCTCTVDKQGGSSCPPSALNCLDDTRVVQVISDLRGKGIKTIVVAFGADVTNEVSLPPLNAMAAAGGFPRECKTATDCGTGQTCDNEVCSVKFYKADNAAQLGAALAAIVDNIGEAEPCVFELSATPSDVRFLAVYVNDERINSGSDTWSYSADGKPKVTFTGGLCEQVMAATPATPVRVEIRLIEGL